MWAALLRVHAALVPTINDMLMSATGLPLAWYDVLLELNAAPSRRLRMSDLGARVVLSRSRVSRVVDELAGAGLVERQTNPADRRSAYAVLTDAGRRRFRAAAPIYLNEIERHFTRHINDADQRILKRALYRVLAAEASPPDLPSSPIEPPDEVRGGRSR